MAVAVPANPKIYHIVHVDRLASIITDGHLWCDREIQERRTPGTAIAIAEIKKRRARSELNSRPGLNVGACVPFYFCPRSVMLYVLHRGNHPNLAYHGGQVPIIHLEADLHAAVRWANGNRRRWAFTLSNAGSEIFEDRRNLAQLHEIDWEAVDATYWSRMQDGKQDEFLMEYAFPWTLI